jgi:endonuclease/exonuclease/phosphatase family metal-dependent hydrolase
MAGMVVASFNVENLFARPKAFDTVDRDAGMPVLSAYQEFNDLIGKPRYSATDVARMRELLVTLGVYYVNQHGAIRRRLTSTPQWAWLRKNRGSFDTEPKDATRSVEITAAGRGSWIGWVELAKEAVDETGTRTTARVIRDVDADVLGIVEAEDRPSLIRLNTQLLDNAYEHVMLVDGNDERGIDVGLMTKRGFEIESIRSNVDLKDRNGPVFSRDCPQYEVATPSGERIHVLVNHFKSQSGGGGPKRRRQATEVRRIVDGLVARGEHVIVMGDLNEGPRKANAPATNLRPLFGSDGPLVSCYDLEKFDTGGRPGSYDSCGLSDRLDYVLLSHGLAARFQGGHLFRKGLWGSRKSRPDKWEVYPELTDHGDQASDHAAVVVELDV